MVLAERARVGREIHDTLLQSLVGLGLQMEDLADELNAPIGVLKRRLMEMRRQVEHYVGEAQQSIWDLRSPAMDTTDLATAIRERAERITKDSGIAFELLTTGSPRPLPSHVQRQVLRIAQEAVVNAVRHASPTKITVEMTFEGDAVHLRVTDNGHGFNPEMPTPSGESHWGMSIMRERVEQIGGRFSVSSAPNRGTRIEIVAPAPAEVA